MNNFEQLLQRCKLLKARIKEFESLPVDENQKSIRAVQLKTLKDGLSEVGRQLKILTIYKKRDEND